MPHITWPHDSSASECRVHSAECWCKAKPLRASPRCGMESQGEDEVEEVNEDSGGHPAGKKLRHASVVCHALQHTKLSGR